MDYRMPLYIQLQDIITKKIEEQVFLPGEKIPSERELAETYGVNRMTVKRAVNQLVEKGYLYRVQGSGTYVDKPKRTKLNMELSAEDRNTGITAMLKKSGMQGRNIVLGKGDLEPSDYYAYYLGIGKEDVVWGLHRVRLSKEKPIAVEYSYVPKKYFEDIDETDFEKVSLYDYMDARDHLPRHFNQELQAVEAGEKEAGLLQVEKGSTIFRVTYIGADRNYTIVEHTEAYVNPELIEFHYQTEAVR